MSKIEQNPSNETSIWKLPEISIKHPLVSRLRRLFIKSQPPAPTPLTHDPHDPYEDILPIGEVPGRDITKVTISTENDEDVPPTAGEAARVYLLKNPGTLTHAKSTNRDIVAGTEGHKRHYLLVGAGVVAVSAAILAAGGVIIYEHHKSHQPEGKQET